MPNDLDSWVNPAVPRCPAPCLGWRPALLVPWRASAPWSPRRSMAKSWPEAWDRSCPTWLQLGRIFVNRDLLLLQVSGFARDFSDNAQESEFCVIQSRESNAEHVALISLRCCTCMLTGTREVPVSMGALILYLTMPLLCTGSLPRGIFSFAIWSLASSLASKPLHHTTQDC